MESLIVAPPNHTIRGLDLCDALRDLDPAEWPCLPLLVVATCRRHFIALGMEGAEDAEGSVVSVREVESGEAHDVHMTVLDERFRVQVVVDEDDVLAWFALYEQFESSAGRVALMTIARSGESVYVHVEESRPIAAIIFQNEASETTWMLEGFRPTVPDLLKAIASNPRPD